VVVWDEVQMPLPLTISCSSKSRLVLTFLVLPFWYLLIRVVPDKFQKSSKMVVCVYELKENLNVDISCLGLKSEHTKVDFRFWSCP